MLRETFILDVTKGQCYLSGADVLWGCSKAEASQCTWEQWQQLACCRDYFCSVPWRVPSRLWVSGRRRGVGLPAGPLHALGGAGAVAAVWKCGSVYYFMSVVVWPSCSSSCAWFPWRPERVLTLESQLQMVSEPPCGCQEPNTGSLEEVSSHLSSPQLFKKQTNP